VKRGELYRVYKGGSPTDPKRSRVFVIVSRQVLIDSRHSTVVCAPVCSSRHGLSTQVPVGPEDGLKHSSAIHCDELVSIPKDRLTRFIGKLVPENIRQLNAALTVALELETTQGLET
jgi:mRNA interferase MazF